MTGVLPENERASGAQADRPRRRWVWVVAVVAALAAVGLAAWAAARGLSALSGGDAEAEPGASDTARAVRDRLTVTITEGGEVEAKRSVDVKCEVEGQSTILWVIEEGSYVEAGDKLMELDSADLEESLTTRRMAYDTATAAHERARQNYEIQKSTNASLLSAANLTVKFALLDMKKYLGSDLADRIIAVGGQVDFATLPSDTGLGGQGLQDRRKLETDIDLAEEELSRAESKLKWTRDLEAKGFVTRSELEADELAAKRRQVELEQARTALGIFLNYDFPKEAERFFTDWLEAKREYDRVLARAESELAAAKADLDAKKAAYDLEKGRFEKVQTQLEKTVIRAPRPGMVVYSRESRRWSQEEIIEVGGAVRHQQTLIQLPDLSEMNVESKLHEAVVKQVSLGDPAFVRIDARPDLRLTGKVSKIAVMPDRQQWWLNPGLKEYPTAVTLDSAADDLKPGMSAQVEILVDDRLDVLQVPVAAVHVEKGFPVVYVQGPGGPETRRVETGLSNDRAVEILKGLAAGEQVYLYKPAGAPELDVPEGAQPRLADVVRPTGEDRPGRGGREASPPSDRPAADADAERPRRLPPGMTAEQAEALRKRFENATPEQRQRMLEEFRRQAEGARTPGAGGGGGGPSGRGGGRRGGEAE